HVDRAEIRPAVAVDDALPGLGRILVRIAHVVTRRGVPRQHAHTRAGQVDAAGGYDTERERAAEIIAVLGRERHDVRFAATELDLGRVLVHVAGRRRRAYCGVVPGAGRAPLARMIAAAVVARVDRGRAGQRGHHARGG